MLVRDDPANCPETVHITAVHDGQTEAFDLTLELRGVSSTGSITPGGGAECFADTGFGVEESGDWSIQLKTADGARTAAVDVSVDSNSCHVETENVDVTLK